MAWSGRRRPNSGPISKDRARATASPPRRYARTDPRTYSARLTVITNGGVAEVPVRLDVAALPFPQPPFQGTVSPREMAERMKNQPKLAVPLLENGEVAHWFALNNWTYPVQGAPARGVAAVQQFFEGMGLSRPPVVQWDKDTLHFTCEPSQVLSGQASLRTTARKWVYASAESDAPWLQLPVSSVSGPQQATLSFKIDAHRMEVGRQHEGHLQVVANAGQQLVLRVLAEVCPPYQPWTRRLLQPFLPAAILGLLYRACLALPADLVGRVWAGPPQPPPGSFAAWLQPPCAGRKLYQNLCSDYLVAGSPRGRFVVVAPRWSGHGCVVRRHCRRCRRSDRHGYPGLLGASDRFRPTPIVADPERSTPARWRAGMGLGLDARLDSAGLRLLGWSRGGPGTGVVLVGTAGPDLVGPPGRPLGPGIPTVRVEATNQHLRKDSAGRMKDEKEEVFFILHP